LITNGRPYEKNRPALYPVFGGVAMVWLGG
jgi:hypothetical protein